MGGRRLIIAVDGPAASGKSTVSREVARILGLKYVDSGAIYRAITLCLLKKYNSIERSRNYLDDIKDLSIHQTFNNDGTSSTYLDGEDVSKEIRSDSINKNIGIISDDIEIRNYVNIILRKWADRESIIMDGRDIGTVVFPDADLKIFMTAKVEIRAQRRYDELKEKGINCQYDEVTNNIITRDITDENRDISPLKRADDAILLDNSKMTVEEQMKWIMKIIDRIINEGRD